MSLEQVVAVVHSSNENQWAKDNEVAFNSLFGAEGGRYRNQAKDTLSLRAPEMDMDLKVRFAAYIDSSNPDKGAYGGMSFVLFPAHKQPCLVGLVVARKGSRQTKRLLENQVTPANVRRFAGG